ncbi:hypothetical protein SAMN05661080_00351 [Modestobacter sp. DSM 44400]|uniref:hypothetical protein n=1 Tax=Modestobacter sp. DSM 44400 TaxID=1550230 RepID=UPI00089A0846|nr:hypothetical protein [Modestobacter sp. DSM 44400]SDX53190.1 hypothetical protein SAMN05661080_00351 [Modestobacter sp. DSM 44400]
MSAVLPPPVPLPDPPGSAAGLLSAVGELTSAGFSAGVLCHQLEPVAVLRGWRGADAARAGSEMAAATAVAGDVHRAVTNAVARLQAHAEAWLLVERRLAVLRARQQEQYAVAAPRLAALVGEPGPLDAGPPPEAAALLADMVAAEAARAAEHRALLAELADDAQRSAAVLAAATGPLGGVGRPGEAPRVTVRLATVLPGWGMQAMTGLGLDAATALTAPRNFAGIDATAGRYTAYADMPAFAEALARGLGPEGTTYLLAVLGSTADTGEGKELAALLARTLHGDGPAGGLLDPRAPDGGVDVVAVGMGVVLAAPGAGPRLAATWGRAMLERERVQGVSAVDRTTGTPPDPVDAALHVLLRASDGTAAADLLATPAAWGAALARDWPDGGAALSGVIDLGAAVPEGAGTALAGLEALGRGLAPGSRSPALDDRALLPAVRDATGGLVAAQVGGPVAGALRSAVGGGALDGATDAALRGLGFLLSQPGQDAVVTGALTAALRNGPEGAEVGEVAGAYVAVQEYGMRVRHALDCAREFANAVDRQLNWTVAVTLPSLAVQGRARPFLVAFEGLAARAFRADSEVVVPRDTRPVRTAADAARLADEVVPGGGAAGRVGFGRAAALLGVPELPVTSSPFDPLDDVDIPDRQRPKGGRRTRRR